MATYTSLYLFDCVPDLFIHFRLLSLLCTRCLCFTLLVHRLCLYALLSLLVCLHVQALSPKLVGTGACVDFKVFDGAAQRRLSSRRLIFSRAEWAWSTPPSTTPLMAPACSRPQSERDQLEGDQPSDMLAFKKIISFFTSSVFGTKRIFHPTKEKKTEKVLRPSTFNYSSHFKLHTMAFFRYTDASLQGLSVGPSDCPFVRPSVRL